MESRLDNAIFIIDVFSLRIYHCRPTNGFVLFALSSTVYSTLKNVHGTFENILTAVHCFTVPHWDVEVYGILAEVYVSFVFLFFS